MLNYFEIKMTNRENLVNKSNLYILVSLNSFNLKIFSLNLSIQQKQTNNMK